MKPLSKTESARLQRMWNKDEDQQAAKDRAEQTVQKVLQRAEAKFQTTHQTHEHTKQNK